MNNSILRPALLSLGLLIGGTTTANNIQVNNAALVNNDPFAGTVQIQFDLSWENSWYGGGLNNWDAAWVFVKFRSGTSGTWQHVQLGNTGHTSPSGSQVDPGLLTPASPYNATSNPVLGVFIHRNTNGTGTLSLPGVSLNWVYGSLGINYIDLVEIKVFAVEMVYVPQGAFAAGSGGSETNAFALTTINTANATTAPSGTGSLGGQAGGYPTGQTAPGNGGWPNGYNAFYCMKYELSQQGYVEFLNTLTFDQQSSRTATSPTSAAGTGALNTTGNYRDGIDIQTPSIFTQPAVYACNLNGNGVFGEAADGKDIACNYLNWSDHAAYLDWSGLRPMTEMEFEKACRGTTAPVPDQYPWGTTSLTTSGQYTLANPGASNEGIASNYSTAQGNAGYSNTTNAGITGPMRNGIFAADPGNSGRVTSGASYYGIMEMAGDLEELTVTLGNTNGRAYTGTHGNGSLSMTGSSDALSWPVPTSGTGGFEARGGSWTSNPQQLRISDRASDIINDVRNNNRGCRGVRTAP